MDFKEVQDWTKFFTGDPNGTRFNATRLKKAVNLANKQFALDAKLFKDVTYTLSGGDVTKSLPSDFIKEQKVTLAGLKLDPITREELESVKRQTDWTADESTTPQFYIVDPEENEKSLRPYPKYPSGSSDKTLIMRYFYTPADMTADSDNPLDGETYAVIYHEAIAAYGAWLLLGGVEPTEGSEAKSRRLRRLYEDKISDALNNFKNTASAEWGSGGGRQGRRKHR